MNIKNLSKFRSLRLLNIFQLINGYYKEDDRLRSLVTKYEFHMLPILNPDGYVYSYSDHGVSEMSLTFLSAVLYQQHFLSYLKVKVQNSPSHVLI